ARRSARAGSARPHGARGAAVPLLRVRRVRRVVVRAVRARRAARVPGVRAVVQPEARRPVRGHLLPGVRADRVRPGGGRRPGRCAVGGGVRAMIAVPHDPTRRGWSVPRLASAVVLAAWATLLWWLVACRRW